MKRLKKKLSLNKQMIAVLQSEQIEQIKGGTMVTTKELTEMCTVSCPPMCTWNLPCDA